MKGTIMQQEMINVLEAIIDKQGLIPVLRVITAICQKKANRMTVQKRQIDAAWWAGNAQEIAGIYKSETAPEPTQ